MWKELHFNSSASLDITFLELSLQMWIIYAKKSAVKNDAGLRNSIKMCTENTGQINGSDLIR